MELKKINFNNLDDKTKGMMKIGMILLGVTFALLIISLIYNIMGGTVLSFDKIENQMIRAAQNYIESNPDKKGELDYSTIIIDVDDLVGGGYLKELSKYTDETTTCFGKVLVHKNMDNYSYTPKLDCKDKYKTKSLVDVITKKENIVTSNAGLYKIETEEPYFLYRGEDVKNYLKIDEKIWRILRINSDNTIRIIESESKENISWDDRYNEEKKYNVGINEFDYTEPSRLKTTLIKNFEENETITNSLRSIVVPHELCVGKKSYNELDNTGNIECSKKSEPMNAGTLYLSEYFQASLDQNCFGIESNSCKNYNYIADFRRRMTTLTVNTENTYDVYVIHKNPSLTKASYSSYLHLVLHLSKDVNYASGDGSLENPYTININA